MVPELERHCGSWTVINNKTGLSVCELSHRPNVERLVDNPDIASNYTVLTTLQYLSRLNRLIAAGSTIANT